MKRKVLMLLLAIALMFALVICFCGFRNDRICESCKGQGYSTTGVFTATEFIFEKTLCKRCDGTGIIQTNGKILC